MPLLVYIIFLAQLLNISYIYCFFHVSLYILTQNCYRNCYALFSKLLLCVSVNKLCMCKHEFFIYGYMYRSVDFYHSYMYCSFELTMVEQTNNTYKSSYRISQYLLGLISNLFCSVRCGLVIFVVPSGRWTALSGVGRWLFHGVCLLVNFLLTYKCIPFLLCE